VDYRSVWSFAHVEKLSFKKPVVAGERERPGVARRRTQWTKYQRRIEPERLVFIDETWTKTNMARRKFVVVNWADFRLVGHLVVYPMAMRLSVRSIPRVSPNGANVASTTEKPPSSAGFSPLMSPACLPKRLRRS
jgi:hypothetical protein